MLGGRFWINGTDRREPPAVRVVAVTGGDGSFVLGGTRPSVIIDAVPEPIAAPPPPVPPAAVPPAVVATPAFTG